MAKIKKNDIVVVLAGKNKGKSGKVLALFPIRKRAIVEGVNLVKKHARRTREDQKGGIVEKESTIHISNLALFCKSCNKATKVGYDMLKDGSKARYCKACKEIF